jgi:membrane protein DedA with SNARE-associated domain
VEHFIRTTIESYGYLAIFVLMVLESACVPIPSEVTMLFGGAAANAVFAASLPGQPRPLNFLVVGLLGTVGNLSGSWIAYGVGRVGGRPLIERWGRYIFLRPHEIDRAEIWFAKHEATVFVSRLLPVIRTFISLPAGVAEMPFWRFTVYTFTGCLPWTFALAGIGYALGSRWTTVEKYLRPVSIVVALALAVAVVWWLVRRAKAKRRQDAAVPLG